MSCCRVIGVPYGSSRELRLALLLGRPTVRAMFVPRHPSASASCSASSPARRSRSARARRLAFDGGATVAGIGAPLRARRARFACSRGAIAARRRGRCGAVRARADDLRPRDRPLLRASLERIDVSLASLLMCSYPALVVAGAVLLRRERASRRRARRSSSRSRVSRSCSPAVSAARSIRSGSARPRSRGRRTRRTCSSRIGCSARPSRSCWRRCSAPAPRRFALGGAQRPVRSRRRRSTLAVVGAIALVATVRRSPRFSAASPDRPVARDDPRHVEPPVTIALSALVFGERLGPLQLLGAGLVVSGVVILQLRRRPTLRPVPAGSARLRCIPDPSELLRRD